MKFALTGSNGFIGSALIQYLKENGHEIIRIVRSNPSNNDILWNPSQNKIDSLALDEAAPDVVVHLAGEGIAEKKWTDAQKKKILNSRTQGTILLSKTLAELKNKPSIFISGSAIGYYGSRGEELLDENSSKGTGFLSDVCEQWEASTQTAKDAGIPVAQIRTGIVLDKSGGTLQRLLLPFKLGIGGRLGKGNQYMSWISLEDHIRSITFIAENKKQGVHNLVDPNPVTNNELTKVLGKKLSRPTILPTPLLPLKLVYGTELLEELLIASQRVEPKALLEDGFEFKHKTIQEALEDII